jgi:hypothetical protein
MIIIKNKNDLDELKESNLISADFYNLVENYFKSLIKGLCPPEEDPDLYNLEKDGYIVVLEEQDNPHSLPKVGLPNGIAHSYLGPEWTEYYQLDDGTNVYQIAYLMDNDFIMIYYINEKFWKDDPIIQEFLQDQLMEE